MKLIKMWKKNDTKFKIYEVNGKYNLYADGYFECREDTVNKCEKIAKKEKIKMAKTNRLIMKYIDFVEQYSDAIEEFANEEIRENEEEYFDGYTSYSDEDYFEVIKENWDEFVRLYAEKIDILLYDDHE